MRFAMTLCLFVLTWSFTAKAQVMPTSNGSCGVSASGVMDCDWMSAVPIRFNTDRIKTFQVAPRDLFVTRFRLAPGAPLSPLIKGHEVLIVGLNEGELVNEATPSQAHVYVTNGLVMLMPRGEPYLFRNAGKQNLDLLVIDVRKRSADRRMPSK